MNIALLGAESSGKSTLAQALVPEISAALQDVAAPSAFPPPPVIEWVPEALREWCMAHGRPPLSHEQSDVIAWQNRLADAARARVGPAGWLLFDTAPLMTAVYSEHYFFSDALTASATRVQQTFDVTLLMGLDLPWQPDGPWRDGPAVQEAIDTRLRHMLHTAAIPFQTIYGTGPQRTSAALLCIAQALPADSAARISLKKRAETLDSESTRACFYSKFMPACEACSDPACEHRLFSQLVAKRNSVRS